MNKLASLTPEIQHIVCDHGTEVPFTGAYNQTEQTGSYLCRLCGLALFRSSDKFISSCGWPSFDDEIPNVLKRLADPDGKRTEVRCARCEAHLGHVFTREGLTAKNKRHCINSLAIDFVHSHSINDSEEAIVAGGCFWGMEHWMRQLAGVVKTQVGYIGDTLANPDYELVCSANTRFVEATRIIYDREICDYQTVMKRFFEIHDPTQANGQGFDIGPQYLSAIFYFDPKQAQISRELIQQLTQAGLNVTTRLEPMQTFWPAEQHHQSYYRKHGKSPHCHAHNSRPWRD